MVNEQIEAQKVSIVVETPKQGTEAMENTQDNKCCSDTKWDWVEASIWTEAMLKALNNGVKGGKWFSLIDKVYRPGTLKIAWEKVKANKGAAGVDSMTIQKFEAQKGRYLLEIEQELRKGTYEPKAVKRVYIPKGQGKLRPLGIPTVKDRIVQQAVKMVLEPIFEKEFLNTSYGFRPNRNAHMAIAEVNQLISDGYTWVVDADLQAYFDSIPHDGLMKKIQERVSDSGILKLLELWLKQEIMEECKSWTPVQGTPQGGVISPLISNVYLHDLDIVMNQAGYKMIRYADDFVILTRTQQEAEAALKLVHSWTIDHKLTLHPEKTHVGNCMNEAEGFEFLGYRFEVGKTWVRSKSIQKFRDRIRQETTRGCSGSMKTIIKTLNPILRGWCNYFKKVTKYTLGTFDSFVRRRLRAICQRRKKKKSFGAGRCNLTIPNKFFADLGMFNMEKHQALSFASQS